MRRSWGKVGAVLFPAMAFSGRLRRTRVRGSARTACDRKDATAGVQVLSRWSTTVHSEPGPACRDRSAAKNRRCELHSKSADQRVHLIRSPDCTAERDKLALMGKPSSHDSPDRIAQQCQRVIQRCSAVEM